MGGGAGERHRGDGRLEPRTVELPSGEALCLRPVRSTDVDGLASLFDRLDAEDRYRRFFSFYRPTRRFIERMTTIGERGGVGLVATVGSVDDEAKVVGEASFSLLPNGDGELGITVDHAWRGWLGPYLLDALVEEAADKGVPNLQADILVTNGPMFQLARARGAAVTGHPDVSVVRVAIGTAAPAPSWADAHERPRLLVELSEGWRGEAAAEHAGVRVVACPGPLRRAGPCPALVGERCPLAEGADAILVTLPPDPEGAAAARSLVTAHRVLHPGVPVCVEIAHGAEPVDRVPFVASSATVADVVALVQRTARRRARDPSRGTVVGDVGGNIADHGGVERGEAHGTRDKEG